VTHNLGEECDVKILVVDDHADVRELLKYMITKEGHEVDLARDRKEATELISLNKYDAAAVDLLLPTEEEGIQTVENLHKSGISRIVLMTGASLDVVEKVTPHLKSMGVNVLIKPFPTIPEVIKALGLPARVESQPT
jgi:DNA-binding response OmpR family regulator